jgi:hypothetical protein
MGGKKDAAVKIVPVLNIEVARHEDVWRSGCRMHVFSTSSVVGAEWSATRAGRFTPGSFWIGGLVDPRACLDDVDRSIILPLPEF